MSILSRKKGIGHLIPQGTVALFFIQVVCTLSFSVLYSTLVLYMKGKLGLHVSTANSIMGVFIAFNFALHLLGGILGGRLLSNRTLFCIGMLAQILGCILLSISSVTCLYYGLAAFLTGSGLNVTCVNCMLTQRFAPEDSRRETAFLWNYAGMNIGFFIGFSLSGIFQLSQNYQRLFLLSSLGNLMALLICLCCWHELADKETIYSKKNKVQQKKATALGVFFIILLPFVLSELIHYAHWANKLVIFIGVSMLAVSVFIAYQQPTKEAKDKILAFTILMIVAAIFWTLYQTGPMGLTVFVDHNVQREYGGWIIPPQWFQNINTTVIVIGGPLLAILFNWMRANGRQINIPTQFAVALFFIGIAFAALPVGIASANANGMVNPGWIVLCYVLQSIGELLISPIGYAMIGYLAPTSLQGVMMGMWMLNSGVGATLASYSSNLMTIGQDSTSALLTNSGYSQVFLSLGLFAIVSSFILLFFIPRLRSLIQEKKTELAKESHLTITKREVLFE